ncbi:hypothetical protein L1049_013994 [Liquidambar formosana]|uniref:MAPK kinase substrate protein n=1 Tax=Liquidambar formosana TaxID=63359 RepID=A0AAP0RR34_LIQFO
MAFLQRSAVSFRRQGSSGLVWDDKLLSGETQKEGKSEYRELRPCQSTGTIGMMERVGSSAAPPKCNRSFSTPAMKPASPKLTGCGFVGVFEKSKSGKSKP